MTEMILALMFLVASCGKTKHTVEVEGRSDNQVVLTEEFCSSDAYPTPAERRICKDQILAAMQCRKSQR
jgi:hypothetical protein